MSTSNDCLGSRCLCASQDRRNWHENGEAYAQQWGIRAVDDDRGVLTVDAMTLWSLKLDNLLPFYNKTDI